MEVEAMLSPVLLNRAGRVWTECFAQIVQCVGTLLVKKEAVFYIESRFFFGGTIIID